MTASLVVFVLWPLAFGALLIASMRRHRTATYWSFAATTLLSQVYLCDRAYALAHEWAFLLR